MKFYNLFMLRHFNFVSLSFTLLRYHFDFVSKQSTHFQSACLDPVIVSSHQNWTHVNTQKQTQLAFVKKKK